MNSGIIGNFVKRCVCFNLFLLFRLIQEWLSLMKKGQIHQVLDMEPLKKAFAVDSESESSVEESVAQKSRVQ